MRTGELGDWALRIRRVCHEMLAVFGGKMPHNIAIVPGGVTCEVTIDKVAGFMGKLQEIDEFVEDVYIPAVLTVAGAYPDNFDIGAGCGRFLAYGGFDTDAKNGSGLLPQGLIEGGKLKPLEIDKITEDVTHSRYTDDCTAAPAKGKTQAAPDKDGAYSWLKAPRYGGDVAEVGPLSRAMVGYAMGHEPIKSQLDSAMAVGGIGAEKLSSVLGRHLARALECRILVASMRDWLGALAVGEPEATELTIPDEGQGVGLTEGPRGALGHWIEIKDRKISRYQLVVPTTWNGSPRDAEGTPGPMEQALLGTKVRDRENPFEVVRIIRSFDPCLACSVHVMTAKGQTRGVYRIV